MLLGITVLLVSLVVFTWGCVEFYERVRQYLDTRRFLVLYAHRFAYFPAWWESAERITRRIEQEVRKEALAARGEE